MSNRQFGLAAILEKFNGKNYLCLYAFRTVDIISQFNMETRNELLKYERPEAGIVLLETEGEVLASSSAGATTEFIEEEIYEW